MGHIPKRLNYHSILFNPKTKQKTFALFIRVVGSCYVGEKGYYNQVSVTNTYVDATFYISLNESKFIKEYKNKISKWSQY
jgi:hypothetical protein